MVNILYLPVFSESEFEFTFIILTNKWCDLDTCPLVEFSDSTGIDTIGAWVISWVQDGLTGTDDKPYETYNDIKVIY